MTKNKYRDTLFLPQTDFPMRAGLPRLETRLLARWQAMNMYQRLRQVAKGREKFILHDGPPYANGDVHMGTALNKIIKDTINRAQQMMGKDANYVPGWDCHGLPIEWRVEEELRAKAADPKAPIPRALLRQKCRAFAQHWVDAQSRQFQRLGVAGDFDNPYTTMNPKAEAAIINELFAFVKDDTLYRALKPVMWSVVEKTALAEAEVDYKESSSHAIWVGFPVRRGGDTLKGARVLIWTTTPWTIPANRAIAFAPDLSYGVYETDSGACFIVADVLAEACAVAGGVETWRRITDADKLEEVVCAHPLDAQGYDFDVPLAAADFVVQDTGTGFVHIAPGHGADDFNLARKLKLPIPETIDDAGAYLPEVPLFAGARVLNEDGREGEADTRVIGALKDAGALFAQDTITHSYPHSWRSKAPVIFRATPQWFIDMEKTGLRDKALQAIDDVRWTPCRAQNRIRAMVKSRPDWVISRQRAWGVPIAIFVSKKTGAVLQDDAVNARILEAVRAKGAQVWFDEPADTFLGKAYNADEYERVEDILDVWFESGATHALVLETRDDLTWPASLYCEGSDQHRGWFQSSLLEACATRGRAPYKAALTHGFVLDAEGRKMSKSLGNAIAMEDIVNAQGADILRLWAARGDYTEDVRIGDEILQSSVDAYRKIRNGFRFLLGNLHGFSDAEKLDPRDMPELERLILHKIYVNAQDVRFAYNMFDLKSVMRTVFDFMTLDLSSFYFDIRKDSLYCDAPDAPRRRACRTLLDLLFHHLVRWLAPILCFTMEEVWLTRFPNDENSVHLEGFAETEDRWREDRLAERWARLRRVRHVVSGALEVARKDKRIGASLDAAVDIYTHNGAFIIAMDRVDLPEIMIVSQAARFKRASPEGAFSLEDVPDVYVAVRPAEGARCARSWKILPEVGTDPDYTDVSLRDAAALRAHKARQAS